MKSNHPVKAALVGLLFCAALEAAATAASFDCRLASTVAEKAVCESDELSGLDSKLGEAFQSARARAEGTASSELLEQQRAWLRDVRGACSDETCLRAVYQDRIRELQDITDAHTAAPAPAAAPMALESPSEAQAEPPPSAAFPASAAAAAMQAVKVESRATSQPVARERSAAQDNGSAAPIGFALAILAGSVAALVLLVRAVSTVLRTALARARRPAERAPTGGAAHAPASDGGRAWLASVRPHAVLATVVAVALLPVHWVLSALALLIYLGWGASRQCPGCRRLFARVGDHSEVIDVDSGYETITRNDEVRSSSGKQVGTIVRKEQVHVTYTTRRHYHACRHCDHTWTVEKTTSS